MHTKHWLLKSSCLCLAGSLLPNLSYAQLEEVIVTAQKREENVQTVPVAVSALSQETLRNASMLTMDDISRQVPGFTVTNYNPVTPQPFIRGVGSSPSDAGSDASVGVFIDGVYAGRAGGYRADMFDIERVEVLRGPQGTLFGRNVAGGALNIISNRPSEEFSGELSVTAGDYNLFGTKGFINGGISDTVSGRFAFSTRNRDGHTDNTVTGSELRDEDNNSYRGRLLWDASDTVSVLLTAEYNEDELDGPAARNYDGASPEVVLDRLGVGFLAASLLPINPDPFKIEAGQDGFANREMSGYTAQVDWDTSLGTVTWVSGYRESEYDFNDDLMGIAFTPESGLAPLLTNFAEEESDQFSQELRLSSVDTELVWTVGVYYLQEDVERLEGFAPLGTAVTYDQVADTTSYAAFGQITFPLADQWDLTVGARYSYDEKEFDLIALGTEIGFGLLTPDPSDIDAGAVPFSSTATEDWSNFSPKVSLEYSPTDDTFVYFTYSEGYKSGGYNGQATNLTAGETPFEPEEVSNYEIGLKTEFWDNKARLNLAAFIMDYTDLQVFVSSVDTTAGLFVDNAGEADIQGFEAEFFYAPTQNFDITASYAWLDAELGENDIPTAQEGNTLTRAPENSGSLAAQYYMPLDGLGTLLMRADYTYQSKIYFQLANPDVPAQDGYGLVNLRLALQADAGWEVALWLKNAADEEYIVHGFDSSFGSDLASSSIQGEPRTWGVTGRYSW